MSATTKSFRQSVSLPPRIAARVKHLARSKRASTNRVLVELIETGLESQATERTRFLALADRLASSKNRGERKRIKVELARMTFGE
jgi:hypothetical protein